MEIKIEIMPSYSIVYIRQIGSYGANNIQVMDRVKSFAKEKNLFDDEAIILGIAHDNPQKTKPENCKYDACLVISDGIEINDEYMKHGRIIGGKYAVFTIEHTVESVGKAWNEIFQVILSKGYKMDISRPIIERYINRMVKNHKCEICVPID